MNFLESKVFFFALISLVPITLVFDDQLSGNYLNQVILFSLPLLWPGLAHGSLDLLMAKKKKIIKNNHHTILFITIYTLIPFVFFILWIFFPNVMFIIFLLLSALHFGISDCVTNDARSKIIEILIRGIIVISLPFIFHLKPTLEIFEYFLIDEHFLLQIVIYFNFLFLLLFFLISSWLIINYNLIIKDKNSFVFLVELFGLLFCFSFFEPLISFFLYFCFLHSTRHLLEEKENLELKNLQLIKKSIPMTVLTFIFFVILFLFYKNSPNNLNISYVIIGLSSLTISHVFLVNFIKTN